MHRRRHRAQVELVTRRDLRALDGLAVEPRAVGGAEVLDPDLGADELEARVVA